MSLRIVFAAVLVSMLAACASQTDYKPAEKRGAYGYTETQLAENRYRITFTGNSVTPKETVQDFALLRAAELTLQNGYQWFKLVNRESDQKVRATTVDTGIGYHDSTSVYQRCGLMSCDTVVYSGGYHSGSMGTATTTTRTSYSSALEVVMGKEPMPDDVEAYDAQKLANTLRRWMGTGSN